MIYKNNQYLKLDINKVNLMEIEVKIEGKNKMMYELEIEEEPNIVICYGNIKNRIDFENIYPSVRIIITNYETIYERYKEIPRYIEYIIIKNFECYFKNPNNDKNNEKNNDKNNEKNKGDSDYDYIIFNNKEKRKEIIKRMIKEERINEYNIMGDSIFTICCNYEYYNEAKEIMERISEEMINSGNIHNKTGLYWCCFNSENKESKSIAKKLVERMSEEGINKITKQNKTALYWAIKRGKKKLSLRLIERTNKININKCSTDENETLLTMACYNNMSEVAIKLMEKMEIETINKMNKEGITALQYACNNKMPEVSIKLVKLMSKERINNENINYPSAKYFANMYHLYYVVKAIDEING
jgi:ankyrin repeat protein